MPAADVSGVGGGSERAGGGGGSLLTAGGMYQHVGEPWERCNNPPVPSNRRDRHRPGVVYGPPRSRDRQSDTGVIIGRFLGLGILLLAFGVLAAGALAFMGDRRGAALATRSPGSATSVVATEVTSFRANATPALLPTIAPTPLLTASAPSVQPSAEAPLVQIGAGFVTFGTRADQQLHIDDPRSQFGPTERIVWSAFLTAQADSIQLHIQILKQDPAAIGGERLISDTPEEGLIRNAQIFQRRIRPELALDGPGIYTVLYLRDTNIVSHGSFEITP